MLRALSLIAASLAVCGCPDFNRAYGDCVARSDCRLTAGQVFSIEVFAVPDPGAATFELTPAGRTCGATCREYLIGSRVQLHVTATAGHVFEAWEGACEGQGADCTLTVASDQWVRARLGHRNVAFVSSGRVAVAALTSVAGADVVCENFAADAGLGGTFVAWVSTSKHNARDRLKDTPGWVTTRGDTVATSLDQLLAGAISSPIATDEHGAFRSTTVATGTDASGATSVRARGRDAITNKAQQTCGDLSDPNLGVTVGHSTGGATTWTDADVESCQVPLPLYCFERSADATAAELPRFSAGKRAFLTVAQVRGDAASDDAAAARCTAEATARGWPGHYRGSPSERGGPWFRSDGVRVLDAAGEGLRAGLLALDDPQPPTSQRWRSGTAVDCAGWTSDAGLGSVTFVSLGRDDGLVITPLDCASAAHLACFEE